jgi:serine/threonine protein kinase
MKYLKLKSIGSGTYADVYLAKYDPSTSNKVLTEPFALKILKDKKDYIENFLIWELYILSTFKHTHIIPIGNISIKENKDETFTISMEHPYCQQSLDNIIHTQLEFPVILKFAYQLSSAIKFLHDNDIAHRDLKPDNVLINKNGDLYLTDFNLSRKVYKEEHDFYYYSNHIVSLYWKSPELLKIKDRSNYDAKAIDMWSLGCIFLDFMKTKDLFRCDCETDLRVLHKRMLRDKQEFYKKNTKPKYQEEEVYPKFLKIIDGLLEEDPTKRLKIDDVMKMFEEFYKYEGTTPTGVVNKTSEVYQINDQEFKEYEDLLEKWIYGTPTLSEDGEVEDVDSILEDVNYQDYVYSETLELFKKYMRVVNFSEKDSKSIPPKKTKGENIVILYSCLDLIAMAHGTTVQEKYKRLLIARLQVKILEKLNYNIF